MRFFVTALADKTGITSVPTTIDFMIDDKGRIIALPNGLVAMLQGVRADRIRSCVACKNWFYAKRADKVTCSPRCGSKHRMKELRIRQGNRKPSEKERNQHNKRRKAKRHAAKKARKQ